MRLGTVLISFGILSGAKIDGRGRMQKVLDSGTPSAQHLKVQGGRTGRRLVVVFPFYTAAKYIDFFFILFKIPFYFPFIYSEFKLNYLRTFVEHKRRQPHGDPPWAHYIYLYM